MLRSLTTDLGSKLDTDLKYITTQTQLVTQLLWFCWVSAAMEQLQQQIVEQHLLAAAQQMEDQIDSEMHQLQKLDEDDMESLRQQRIQQMKKAALKKKEWLTKGHGEYNEIATEKEFFAEMKGEERMVCHFYRDNWPCKASCMLLPWWPACPDLMAANDLCETSFIACWLQLLLLSCSPSRCLLQVIDKHLQILAKKHVETKFIKVWQHLHIAQRPIGSCKPPGTLLHCKLQQRCRFMQRRAHS